MPDASGTPTTNLSIPTYNTGVDPPSGKGFNTAMAYLDTLLNNVAVLAGFVARTIVRKNGSSVGTRRAINFIEGANVTLTVADDAGNEEVDVTIASAASSVAKGTWSVTLTAQNTNTQVVTHSFGSTPTAVVLTPTAVWEAGGTGAMWYVTAIGATTFTVNVKLMGGASGTVTVTGTWMAS